MKGNYEKNDGSYFMEERRKNKGNKYEPSNVLKESVPKDLS